MLEKLREVVEADPDVVGKRGANGQLPLHFASTVAVAQYLLQCGAEIDSRDLQHESTPAQHMLRVIQARHYPRDRQDVARYLVSRGCQTDILMAAALGDRTPHQVAHDFSHQEVFQFLMERSPQDVKESQACQLGDESLFRTMLASRPNMARTLSDQERRQLADAAQSNNTSAVRLMLSAGWPVDTRGEYNMTPLQWASWHGNAEMVREILCYHPQLEVSCDHGITALGCALHGSMNGWHRDTGDYAATVEALLTAGAKAPSVTYDLEASEPVRELLNQYQP